MMTRLIFVFVAILLIQCNKEKKVSFEQVALNFKNGNLFCEGTHIISTSGRKNRTGIWKFYYPNGQLENIMEFDKRGNLMNLKKYNESGTLNYTEVNSDKQLLEIYYFENGKIETESITDIETDDEGDETYKTTVTQYYENGQPKQRRHYINDVLNGDAMIWDAKGNLQIQYKYRRGLIVLQDKMDSSVTK